MDFLLIAAGIAIVVLTLRDVITSVVEPGAAQGWLKLAERIRALTFPMWRKASARRQSAARMSRSFAPFVLVATLAGWTILLLAGFGLVLYGLRDAFDPPLRGFGDAVYAAGVSLVTIGMGQSSVHGAARWGVLAAGFSGLFVITLTVTYILSVQSALQRRDTRLVSLTALPGAPRTGVALLETYGRMDCIADLRELFAVWAEWSSAVAYGHTAHPALVYFRSVSADLDWPTALGVVMDAAALHVTLADQGQQGSARILLASGQHTIEIIARRFDLEPAAAPEVSSGNLRELTTRLEAAGYPLRSDADALQRFAMLRSQYTRCLVAVTRHLGTETPELL